MTDYTPFFSKVALTLRESAIRRSSDLAARTPGLISFAPGFPDHTAFAWDEFREIATSILSGADGSVLQYGPTRGYAPLHEALVELLGDRGIRASPEQTIITTGSQQALSLCAQVFIDPGAAALVELPTYTGGITAFGNAQARLVGVQQNDEGIDLECLTQALQQQRADGRRVAFLYVIPNFQNPTGVLTSLRRRQELLQWASAHDVLIVEDDPYGALYFEDVTSEDQMRPLKADDREGRVVYLSSFSKTIAPGLRVAWITADRQIIAKLEIAKQSADLCSSSLDQRIAYEIWKGGTLARRLPILRDCYRRKRTVMERALRQELGGQITWIEPRGGFFLWATFPEGIDPGHLLPRAVAHGVAYVPGAPFFVDHVEPRHARLAFSAASAEQIETGVHRLAAAITEERDSLRAKESRAVSGRPQPAGKPG
jgi:2-aminoadipate transaminase